MNRCRQTKEAVDRPQNCKLLATTRVNPEIWEIWEAIDTGSPLPSKEQMWEALSHSSVLVALANHDLNICR